MPISNARADLTMISDHGTLCLVMEALSISRFKATCLAVLERVRRTGVPVLVTKRGEPIAQVVPPPAPPPPEAGAFGCMRGTAREVGDLLESLPEEEWEALR
jgi:prevent-host-death family protein